MSLPASEHANLACNFTTGRVKSSHDLWSNDPEDGASIGCGILAGFGALAGCGIDGWSINSQAVDAF